ncbi:GPW/gp25 family protein [Nocardioides sp. SR21]|uniref:GPW/gp25 family protein n=1 Tax=Nocardioides sp. SR21 TaxID=2919501 RepID=UPI001FAB3280|nr:GPW/gp25 family protein [Nocardioides sp. SR21]
MPTHLALPLQVTSSGQLAALEQDSPLEVAQSVALLIGTRPGERRSVPDYGAQDMVAVGIDPAAIAAAVEDHEPRVSAVLVDELTTGVTAHAVVQPIIGEEQEE